MWEEKPVQIGHLRLNLAAGPDNGPPILMLHGVTRSWRDFTPVLPAITARCKVFATDLRGHGRSDRADRYLVTDFVLDTLALLRNYQARPTVLWGHSLGAMVAAAVAAYSPEHIAAVILEDPPFHTMGDRMSPSLLAFFAGVRDCALMPRRSVAEAAAQLAAIRLPTANGKTIRLDEVREATQIRFGARCLQDLDPGVLAPIIQGEWLDGYDVPNLIRQIRCPVLLLAGDYSHGAMLTPEDADMIASSVADCTRVDFPGAAHLLHWHQTEEVLRHVLAFLECI